MLWLLAGRQCFDTSPRIEASSAGVVFQFDRHPVRSVSISFGPSLFAFQ
jgi:hypothetical protein